MAIDKATDGNAEKVPDQGRQVAKRARVSMGGDSTVSRIIPHSRDTSPLRKTAPQSDWAHDFTPPMPMPDNVREWNKTYAYKLPYNVAYDEVIYARIPAGRHMNPHLWATQREPCPELPLSGHEAFTPGPFQYVHINYWRLLGNLQPAQRKMLEEDLTRWLAVVPHGGSRAVNEQAPELCAAIEEVIWTFRFAGYSREAIKAPVMAPDPRSTAGPNGTNDFAQPWPMFVDLANDDKGLLRAFLLHQQHFAFDRSRSFSVHSMEESPTRSWKTILLVSHLIAPPGASHGDIVDARSAIRKEIIRRLVGDDDYRVLIAQLAANHIGHTGGTLWQQVPACRRSLLRRHKENLRRRRRPATPPLLCRLQVMQVGDPPHPRLPVAAVSRMAWRATEGHRLHGGGREARNGGTPARATRRSL